MAATPVGERRRRPAEAFVALAREPRRAKPLLLIVEDVHWADEDTLGALAGIAAAAVLAAAASPARC